MSTLPTDYLQPQARSGVSALRGLFEQQRLAFGRCTPNYQKRSSSLESLADAVLDQQAEIVNAVDEDFGGRARQETLALELAPLADAIRHARRHLASWMKPRNVRAGMNFFPAHARIIH